MQTKLTLRIESQLIERAKKVAEERNTSLSRLVSGFFGALIEESSSSCVGNLPPRTKSLHGALRTASVEDARSEYRRYIDQKHS